MKLLQIIFSSLLFLTACDDHKLPEGVLQEQKMVDVLTDLHVIDGYESALMYTDTARMQRTSYYSTIYKNHNISKAQFDKSMKYYSTQPVLLDSMFSKVVKKLEVKEKRILKNRDQEQKKTSQSK